MHQCVAGCQIRMAGPSPAFSTVSPWFRHRRPAGVCAALGRCTSEILWCFSRLARIIILRQFSCGILEQHPVFLGSLHDLDVWCNLKNLEFKNLIWIGRYGRICKHRHNCSPSPPAHSSFTYHKLANVLGEPLHHPAFILKSLLLELLHTAMIDSWIWIGGVPMFRQHKEGTWCIFSWQPPPTGLPALLRVSAWHVCDTQTWSVCVHVCAVCARINETWTASH